MGNDMNVEASKIPILSRVGNTYKVMAFTEMFNSAVDQKEIDYFRYMELGLESETNISFPLRSS